MSRISTGLAAATGAVVGLVAGAVVIATTTAPDQLKSNCGKCVAVLFLGTGVGAFVGGAIAADPAPKRLTA